MNRPCLEPGCDRLTTKTRCVEHESERQRRRNAERTHYHGPWKRISREARAEQPWCSFCGAIDDLTVDHIEPRSLSAGVRVVCRSCNSSRGNRMKPDDLLAAGRVEIVQRSPRQLVAEVEGETGRWRVENTGTGWLCSCPGFMHRRRCSHLDAVLLVAAEPGYRRLRPVTNNTPPQLFDGGAA